MKKGIILLLTLVVLLPAYTIHVKPQFTGDKLYIYGNNEFGWAKNSATSMTNDGDGWFSVFSTTSKETGGLVIAEDILWDSKVMGIGSVAGLFKGMTTINEVWVVIEADGTKTVSFFDPNEEINDSTDTDSTRILSAIVRDQKEDGIEFEVGVGTGHVLGMVEDTLTPEYGILKGSVNALSNNLESWFENKDLGGGQSNDTCITMVWRKTADDGWEYNSDLYGGFFPIDDFDNPNNSAAKYGRNYHFTMELHSQFEYEEGENQIFEFSGDDDVWIFINRKLAIDIGGVHGPITGVINLDDAKNDLGLVDGETYGLDIFFCERNRTGSNFRAKTSLDLHNSLSHFFDIKNISKDEIHYLIKKLNIGINENCGFNINDDEVDTLTTSSLFHITGPQFGAGNETLLAGKHYGGITVHGDTALTLNRAAIIGLFPGDYVIECKSKEDGEIHGLIKFTVDQLVRNLIIPDTIFLPYKQDTIIEALGIEKSTWSGDDLFTLINDSMISVNPTVDPVRYRVHNITTIDDAEGNPLTLIENDSVLIIRVKALPTVITSDVSDITFTTATCGGEITDDGGEEIETRGICWSTTPSPDISSSKSENGSGLGSFTSDIKGLTEGTIYYVRAYAITSVGIAYGNEISFTTPLRLQLKIHSSLSDKSSFQIDTTTFLWATVDSDMAEADIYYLIHYDGSTTIPDSLTGTLYDPTIGISFDTSVTITAIAYSKNALFGTNSWDYNLDLRKIEITATPAEDPAFHFGETIDTISLSSNDNQSITLQWILDDKEVTDEKTLKAAPTYDAVTNFPSIEKSDSDTMYLSVIAMAKGYKTTLKSFKYIRQYLPEIIADPYDKNGCKFNSDTSVHLTISDADNIYKNVKIHYILTNDKSADVGSFDREYKNKIDINKTIYIKAIAYADNAITSPVFTGYYIAAAGVESAYYLDRDNDGAIDAAHLILSKEESEKPSALIFTSPFDSMERCTVETEDMNLISKTEVEALFKTQFSFTGKTGFDKTVLGEIDGETYLKSEFNISDSVAPVIRSAAYSPGEITSTRPVVRALDTLTIIYSEEVTIDNKKELVHFYKSSGSSYEIQYESTIVETINNGGDKTSLVTSMVDATSNHRVPQVGDSININNNSLTSDFKGSTQIDDDNRHASLQVLPIPYRLVISALSPVNPKESSFPPELEPITGDITSGIVIDADFLIPLLNSDLDAKISIFDPVGNLISSCTGIDDGNENLSIERRDEKSTKLLFYWSCKNKNGRVVGPGTYSALIEIKDGFGETIRHTLLLGVKTE